MSNSLAITPVVRPIDAVVGVPGSKSITNRALLMAAMSAGTSRVRGALFSDDTRYMAAALQRLGITVRADEAASTYEVDGTGGKIPVAKADLFVGNAGTAARFLTAFLGLGHGTFRIDGVPRMRQRPIQDLLCALRDLGVEATAELDDGCLPVVIRSQGVRGGSLRMRASLSSQYVTAMLLIAPLSAEGLTIDIEDELVSQPYIDMTLRMMEQWGVTVERNGYGHFHVPGGQQYQPRDYMVEPDASGASYFFAAAAVTGGRVRVEGIGKDALQGDVDFVDVLQSMGCAVEKTLDYIEVRGAPLHGVQVDMNAISDTVMTLAAIAPFANAPTVIENVAHIRVKETDRLHAVATELRRMGVRVDERDDGLTIHPCEQVQPAAIQTYDDHRMAMSFAVAGLRAPGITICDPECVAKTFPDFFRRFRIMCQDAIIPA